MSFLYPWFLLALSAISIPIIIHLFQFRRYRKVYFSNIRFLEQISEETHRQSRLKHLLVLLARILTIIFLVLGFARPYIPADTHLVAGQLQHVSIYLDNSFSMESGSERGTLLDNARYTAREIVESFSATDRYMLLTNDFEGRHQRLVSREEFMGMLQEVDFSAVHRPLQQVIERQRDLLRQEPGNDRLFVLSDFQKIISDFSQLEPDTLIQHFFLPFQSQQPANLWIDSLWIDNPVRMSGQRITLTVRIVNDSPEALINQPLRLFVNDTQRVVAGFDVQAGSYTDVSMSYTPGATLRQQGWAEISDYPVQFDDRMYFSFQLSDKIPVLIINQGYQNPFLQALLGRDTTFVLTRQDVQAVDYSLFPAQNLIILNELQSISDGLAIELKRFTEDGGKLLVFPGQQINLASYNAMLASMGVNTLGSLDTTATRVVSFNELHPVYAGVFDRIPENMDFPGVSSHYVITRSTTSRAEELMTLQNGNSFFVSVSAGQGQVYLSAVPANDVFSNFPRHALFVPTVFNIALHSASRDPLYYVPGRDETIALRRGVAGMTHLLRISGNDLEAIPEARTVGNSTRLLLHSQIREAGQYELLLGEQFLQDLAFNYDRRESVLESYTARELEQQLEQQPNAFVFEPGRVSVEKQLEYHTAGRQLWKLSLLLALVFLFAEVLLLRFMKS